MIVKEKEGKIMQEVNFRNPRLCDLAIVCSMYNVLTPFNTSLRVLKESTPGGIDLANLAHRTYLLSWLNDWGCRHLSKESHPIASSAILDWHNQFGIKLFPRGKALWELDTLEMAVLVDAYGSLKDRTGARPTRGGKKLQVDIGPTAASKILFTIRPEALMPWDEAMRNEFDCDGSKESYLKFLTEIRELTFRIAELCQENGFSISELPDKINRKGSTVLEIINEYIWVIVTRKCKKLPSAKNLALWANWSS
jgi:hypothetical protein